MLQLMEETENVVYRGEKQAEQKNGKVQLMIQG